MTAIVFDFDGVLVESGDVKTQAFAHLFAHEDPEVTKRIIAYHVANGGVSRFEKFRVIYRDILRRPLAEETFQYLCDAFAAQVVDRVVAAPWVPGAREFLERHTGRDRMFIVSGTPEQELKQIVHRRGMECWFTEVRGSPEPKEALFASLLAQYDLAPTHMVFVGDALSDWVTSRNVGVPFVWRKHADGARELLEFSGPTIHSLWELESYLPGEAKASTSMVKTREVINTCRNQR